MAELNLVRGELPGCLADVPDNTYHAVLTDCPYGLGKISDIGALLRSWLDGEDGKQSAGMLSRTWDVVVSPAAWREYLRVTRPGGLCFAYSHSRCYHLQALSLQIAGWTLLPMIVRIHGSAMALGQSTGKAIDKAAGAEREVVGTTLGRPGVSAGNRSGNRLAWANLDEATTDAPSGTDITAPATPLAALFEGFNTALKNQIEPIVVAVKPPDGTWAENAARWGTGCFNVQAGRVPGGRVPDIAPARNASVYGSGSGGVSGTEGRYPSNLLLEHLSDCGADWCAPGCGVRELGEMGREKGVHSAGAGSEKGRLPGTSAANRNTLGLRETQLPFRIEDGGEDSCARFFYQSRASARERSAGCEDLPWLRDPKHPDGWELTDWETWERGGDAAAEKAKGTDGYRERVAEGYMRTVQDGGPGATDDTGVYGSSRSAGSRVAGQAKRTRQVLDVDRLDAAAYLDAARARVRTTGSPHLAVKALDGGAYLAKLLLQPVVDGEEPRLAVFYAGTGSETVGAMLGGWKRIDAFELSSQWNVVHEARWKFWQEIVEKGGTGKALEMLKRWGTAPGEDPERETEIEQLSIFDVAGAMA